MRRRHRGRRIAAWILVIILGGSLVAYFALFLALGARG